MIRKCSLIVCVLLASNTLAQQNTMQATWDARLSAMREAFSDIKAKDTKNRDTATRAVEWTQFQRAFNSDIPGTDQDREMMTYANQRLEQLADKMR